MQTVQSKLFDLKVNLKEKEPMAVFTCEQCGATLKKQQVERHCAGGKCAGAWYFTCIECLVTLEGYDYKEHNICMTEVDKYQGKFIEKVRVEKQKAKEEKMLKK